jgi:hypothetical protein
MSSVDFQMSLRPSVAHRVPSAARPETKIGVSHVPNWYWLLRMRRFGATTVPGATVPVPFSVGAQSVTAADAGADKASSATSATSIATIALHRGGTPSQWVRSITPAQPPEANQRSGQCVSRS